MKPSIAQAKALLQGWFEQRGFQLQRIDPLEQVYRHGGVNTSAVTLSNESRATLRSDHPDLLALRRRYLDLDSPLSRHTLWNEDYRSEDLDLANFRGDNLYVWQLRNVREQARLKYFLYGRYVQGLDTRGLLKTLKEDGQFGCWAFEYQTLPLMSRDLLDSINELYFLDRQLGIFGRQRLRVLDIGAGYGRMAHRMCEAIPGLERYWCVDAIPESTFLCEYYLRHRGCLSKAQVVPLDRIDQTLPAGEIDLALNIHSFSEMPLEAIAGWLDEVLRLRIRWLLIVPNDADRLLSFEHNRGREDYAPILEFRGFRLHHCEPVFADPDLRELMGVRDCFMLFENTDTKG